MRWYVVHTQPRAELRALWHLENQGFHAFLPYLRTLRRHARKVEPVRTPLFPRYLFVALDVRNTPWRSIIGTRGVVSLLCSGAQPLAARDGTVETLLQKCDETGVVPIAALGIFAPGEDVRITCGVFAGQVGKIVNLSAADRVSVLLNFMGTPAQVQLPLWNIEAA